MNIQSAINIHRSFSCESPISTGKNTTIYENVKMGRYSYIGSGFIYPNTTIGRFCSIGINVVIGLGSHPLDWLSTSSVQYNAAEFSKITDIKTNNKYSEDKETIIKNDVWIGTNACIMAGVVINDGAVVGTGAVVTKDVPPYAIVVGVPARIIRYRFEPNIIEKLLKSKWWEKDFSELKELPFNDINSCLAILNNKP